MPDRDRDDEDVAILPSDKESVEYNRLFDVLVASDEEGLTGFVAYVLYKIAKREWVRDFYATRKRHPNDAEMRSYISGWTPTRIDGIRTEANQALTAYASYVVDKAKPGILSDALKEKSFFRDAFVAFCGAFIYSLALILVAVVLHFFGIDLVEISKNFAPR